jgi:hypothetical protein
MREFKTIMNLASRVRGTAAMLAAVSVLAFAGVAGAQEFTDAHLKAARAAISALNATGEFDEFLPSAAQQLKQQLIQKNPDLAVLISTTVDEKTLELVARRGDLEREASLIYARVFSEQQLNEITAFYNTETGKKLMADGDIVGRQTVEAAVIWQRGVARDLAELVGKHLNEVTRNQVPVPEAPAAPGAPVNQSGG